MKKKCETCERDLTSQEREYKDGSRCYFCLSDTYEMMAKTLGAGVKDQLKMPNSADFGRQDVSASSLAKQLPDSHKFAEFDDSARVEFIAKFGFDPIVPEEPTVITVYGDNEDSFLKLSFGAPVQIKNHKLLNKFETILQTTFDALCQMATFGPMNMTATMDKFSGPEERPGRNPMEGY